MTLVEVLFRAPGAARDDAQGGGCLRTCAMPMNQSLQALGDTFLGEGLEQVIHHPQVKGFQRVLLKGGGQNEEHSRMASRQRAYQLQAGAVPALGGELHVDEDDVHGKPGGRLEGLTRLAHGGDGSHHLCRA